MKRLFFSLLAAVLLAGVIAAPLNLVHAQNLIQGNIPPVQPGLALYYTTAQSATAAVATQTTLSIAAPAAGLYNYVCYLAYQVGNDNTGTAISNVVSTSTNFNSFATKFSSPATASIDSGVIPLLTGNPATGCSKSTAAATATTFVSPAGLTHSTWTWYVTFFQAP